MSDGNQQSEEAAQEPKWVEEEEHLTKDSERCKGANFAEVWGGHTFWQRQQPEGRFRGWLV